MDIQRLARLLGLRPEATVEECAAEIRRLQDLRAQLGTRIALLERQVAELRRLADQVDAGDDGI